MLNLKRFVILLLALVILAGTAGFVPQSALAAGCTRYHTVHVGQTLSWIGRYYGVNWTYLASINGIRWPYTVYAGQAICISTTSGGTGGWYYPTSSTTSWSFSVIGVEKDTNATILTQNVPSNVWFQVKMGRVQGNSYQWVDLPDLDTDSGGSFKATFTIPAQFVGTTRLVLRLKQVKKNGKVFTVDQWFNNMSSWAGTGGPGGYPGYNPGYYPGSYWGIPTIWIVGVTRNSTVTIRTYNFPAGVTFDVLMGPMGTRGQGGYYVGTLSSGGGGTVTATYNIPSQLYNHRQISIRTQNISSGYYSYNWFYNNTTY